MIILMLIAWVILFSQVSICLAFGTAPAYAFSGRHQRYGGNHRHRPTTKTQLHYHHYGTMVLAMTITSTNTYEVCLSPGCIADGAETTLQKMQAKAPILDQKTSSTSNMRNVQKGVCCSLCGNGPVVVQNDSQKFRKVNTNEKILKTLIADYEAIENGKGNDDDLDVSIKAILDAFDYLKEAKVAISKNDILKAVESYEQGVNLGLATINNSIKKCTLEQVTWLIHALQEQADCLLHLASSSEGNNDEYRYASMKAAESAVDLCRGSNVSTIDPEDFLLMQYTALETLQHVLEALGNNVSVAKKIQRQIFEKEIKALHELLSLEEPQGLTTTQKNKRRSLGFRLQKLEKGNQ